MLSRVRFAVGAAKSAARCTQLARITTAAAHEHLYVNINFVDEEGNKATLKGRVGDTLADMCLKHKIDLEATCDGGGSPVEVARTESWSELTFGEGPQCFYCHVKIPSRYADLLPPRTEDEVRGMTSTWQDDYSPTTSRLACQIKLEKKHEGMVVYVPSPPIIE